MKITRHFLLMMAVAASAMALGSCRRVVAQANEWLSKLAPPSSASDPVLARVGEGTVTQSDFLRYLRTLPADYHTQAISAKGRRAALETLASQAAILALARQSGLERDPGYQQSLKTFSEGRLSTLYMERVRADLSVSSAEVRAYYETHPQEFAEGSIHASHILTKSFEEAQKAQDLLTSGKLFGEVAQALSIDSASAKNGGRMPPSRTGQVDPAFEQALISLAKGQVSWIVKTGAGYELIRKDEDVQGISKPFQIVAPAILNRLRDQKMYKDLEDAKSKLAISIDEKKLDELDLTSR